MFLVDFMLNLLSYTTLLIYPGLGALLGAGTTGTNWGSESRDPQACHRIGHQSDNLLIRDTTASTTPPHGVCITLNVLLLMVILMGKS